MDDFKSSFLERFGDRLQALEVERLKLVQERKAYAFIFIMVLFLALCCVLSAVIGQSRVLAILGVVLLFGCEIVRRVRLGLGSSYQIHFREQVTRDWFHLQFPGAYLSPTISSAGVPPEILAALREVCVRATAQNPSRTSIEERVFFDSDSYQTWKLILKERSAVLGGVKSRSIVWLRLSAVENRFVAYAWPASNRISRVPEVRFFEGGRVVEAIDPLRARLVALYESIRSLSGGAVTRVALSPAGVWAGVRVMRLPLEAPVDQSCLDPASYRDWPAQAQLLVDSSIAAAMTGF